MKQINIFETGNMRVKFFFVFTFLYLFAFSITIATPQDSLKIIPLNPLQKTPTVYTLSFVTTDTLLPDATIEVTLSNDFDLSKVRIANSTNINGGFIASVNGNAVVLKRKGTGRIILPGEKVDVQFGLVVNPQKEQVDFRLKVAFKNASNLNKQKVEQIKLLFPGKRIEER